MTLVVPIAVPLTPVAPATRAVPVTPVSPGTLAVPVTPASPVTPAPRAKARRLYLERVLRLVGRVMTTDDLAYLERVAGARNSRRDGVTDGKVVSQAVSQSVQHSVEQAV